MGSVAEKFLTDPFFLVDPGQICFYIFFKIISISYHAYEIFCIG